MGPSTRANVCLRKIDDFKFTDSYKNFDETYFTVIVRGDIAEIPMTKKSFSRFNLSPGLVSIS